jgi:uncharacterized protein (TIGR02147 family)
MWTASDTTTCRVWLAKQLSQRQVKNPHFSLRAFARMTGLSAPTLSQVLSGKRPLSRKSAKKIVEGLRLGPEESREFLSLLIHEHPLPSRSVGVRYEELAVDKFQLIANWYYYAILSLGQIDRNRLDPKWIGRRLGIPPSIAAKAIQRLLRLGLIEKKGKGFIHVGGPIWVSTQADESAIRNFHINVLDLARQKLEERKAPMELYTSMVLAVNPDRVPRVRRMIRNMRDRISTSAERGVRSKVYALAIQFFPISEEQTQ